MLIFELLDQYEGICRRFFFGCTTKLNKTFKTYIVEILILIMPIFNNEVQNFVLNGHTHIFVVRDLMADWGWGFTCPIPHPLLSCAKCNFGGSLLWQLPSFRSRHDTSVGVGVLDALLGLRAVLAEVEIEVNVDAKHATQVLRPHELPVGGEPGAVLDRHLVVRAEDILKLQLHAPTLPVVTRHQAVRSLVLVDGLAPQVVEARLHVGAHIPVVVHGHQVAAHAPIGVGVGVVVALADVAVHIGCDLYHQVLGPGLSLNAHLRVEAVKALLVGIAAHIHAVLIGRLLHKRLVIVAVAGEPLGTEPLGVDAQRELIAIERDGVQVGIAAAQLVDVHLLLHVAQLGERRRIAAYITLVSHPDVIAEAITQLDGGAHDVFILLGTALAQVGAHDAKPQSVVKASQLGIPLAEGVGLVVVHLHRRAVGACVDVARVRLLVAQSKRETRVLDILLIDGLGDGGIFIAVHVRGYLLRVRTISLPIQAVAGAVDIRASKVEV